MKNIIESPEVFEAYAKIDLAYYGLIELNKQINKPKTGLEILVDRQTGFDKAQQKEWIESSIDFCNQIIENKKLIDADYSTELKMIKDLKGVDVY